MEYKSPSEYRNLIMPLAKTVPAVERKPTLREQYKLLTREKLLQAALKVFSEVGFRAATVDQIAVAAHTTRTTFYRHFETKADVANGLGNTLKPLLIALVQRLDEIRQPDAAQVRAWLVRWARVWKQQRAVLEVLHDAISSDPSLAAESLLAIRDLVEQMRRYLSSFPANQQEKARMSLVFAFLQLDRVMYFTEVRPAELPQADRFEVLTELWLRTLSRPGC
jgi:AcrR family transcriptional regulator